MIVDVFPFFAPYNEELLYLRVNLLKDVVDKFIIIESDKTHMGEPVERRFMEVARKQGLPIEKIVYIEHDIPETQDLVVRDVDRMNAGEQRNNPTALFARVRERLQKDAMMMALNDFKSDDVFIYGDCDEIINPKNVKWVANMARNNPDMIVKIPLALLAGRADLRCYDKNTGGPTVWMRAMFFATKAQIMNHTTNNIRCGNIPQKICWPTQDNKIIQDMGWHFAWMGTQEHRAIKAKSFTHASDVYANMEGAENFTEFYTATNNKPLVEGEQAPDGHPNHILKNYPISELPSLILEDPYLRDFFLPETDIKKDFAFNKCKCYWCEKLQWPLLYDLENNEEKLWFEVPRSCSVTIKESFPKRRQIYRETRKYNGLWMDSKKPIVIFTDPIERFVSLINAYVTPKQRYYDYGKDIFNQLGLKIEEVPKEQKIDLFFKNLHKLSSHHQVHHFMPQSYFVDLENFTNIEVVKKHDVSDYFGIEEKMNVTNKEITAEDFTEEQVSFINTIYASDYQFYEKYGNGKKPNKRKAG